jgi:hypothetical protein
MTIFFKFDKIEEGFQCFNLTNYNNTSHTRVGISPVATTILRKSQTTPDNILYKNKILSGTTNSPDQKYIIAVGVGYSPLQWCGPDSQGLGIDPSDLNKKNIFCYLRADQLNDLRSGKAFFLLDQTHEGYHIEWLWDWFHNTCNDFSINPKQIIYITGDIEAEQRYKEWANSKNITPSMCVLGWPHFENVIYDVSTGYTQFGVPHPGKIVMRKLPNYEHHVDFKKVNPSGIKPFNILQKRPRGHRLWFYKYLHDANLVKSNIISMNKFSWQETYTEGKVMDPDDCNRIVESLPIFPIENPENYKLENFVSSDGGEYIIKINDVTMLYSWCTIVSEASCADHENTCFISEKTFKPIICQHPFIILGSKGILKNLQKLGYKTFHPYINEEYDNLSTFERMEAIVKEMQRLQKMNSREWFEWYSNIEGILKYNHKHMINRANSYVSTLYNFLVNHAGS